MSWLALSAHSKEVLGSIPMSGPFQVGLCPPAKQAWLLSSFLQKMRKM